VAAPVRVNVHVFVLFPPLEQAPDQTASRPFETLNVICVPVVNVPDPVLPTATLMPAGLDVTRSPLRPLAVTVSVAVCPGGGAGVTVSVAVLVAAPYDPLIVTGVEALTAAVGSANFALVLPAAILTLVGTVAAVVLLVDSVTTAPPDGAALVSVAVPCEPLPPTTVDGLSEIADSDGGDVADCGVKLRTADHTPAVPAEFTPRTRHQYRRQASVPAVNCDTVTVWSTTRGAENVLESSIWIWYETAALTSVQSSVTGSGSVAPSAGLTSAGADGVGGGGGGGGGVTVSVAPRLTPAEVAVMVTDVELCTVVVVIAKVALAAPPAMVTVAGTLAALPLLDSAMTAPPDGAGPLSAAVPCDAAPPATLEGLTVSDASVATPGGPGAPGSTQRIGWSPFPSLHTVIITGVDTATLLVLTVKVALLAPAGTVTLAGTDATEGLLLVSVYTCPPAGATFMMCTFP